MKALTIDALWAWAIVAGVKRVENRTWRTRHRGALAIHAARRTPPAREARAREHLEAMGVVCPRGAELDKLRGCLLGVVDVVGCVRPEALPTTRYVSGPHCWILSNPRRLLRPIPCRGRQGLWSFPGL